jgi:hypothetical protein
MALRVFVRREEVAGRTSKEWDKMKRDLNRMKGRGTRKKDNALDEMNGRTVQKIKHPVRKFAVGKTSQRLQNESASSKTAAWSWYRWKRNEAMRSQSMEVILSSRSLGLPVTPTKGTTFRRWKIAQNVGTE